MKRTQRRNQDGIILIIEHEPHQGRVMADWLAAEGYRVQVESSGHAGLNFWQQQQPAVLVCAIDAPDMDAETLLEAIAVAESDAQVILLSGSNDMDSALAAVRLGAMDYLKKPVADRNRLILAVNRAFDEHQLIRENRRYREALESKNRELDESLRLLKADQEAGRAVQLKMLPESSKDFGNLRIEYLIIPSLYLSGDFVDYFRLGPHQIGFYLADVSGHGASSAFITVLLKNMSNRIRQRYREDFSSVQDVTPADVLQRFNHELIPLGLGKHLAIFCGLIDMQANTLTYCSAAHLPAPILLTQGKLMALEGKGLPVGLFEEAAYENHRVSLGSSFDLVLFSDGILELLPKTSVAEKEQLLMAIAGKGIHTIDQLSDHLGLQNLESVPDDIAIMTVTCRAVSEQHG